MCLLGVLSKNWLSTVNAKTLHALGLARFQNDFCAQIASLNFSGVLIWAAWSVAFCELDFHNVVECPDTLIDCPLFRANCCNVTDCAGVLRRGAYETHLDATPHRATITLLLKRLHESDTKLKHEQKKQRTADIAQLLVKSP
eukprot:gene43193-53612_t